MVLFVSKNFEPEVNTCLKKNRKFTKMTPKISEIIKNLYYTLCKLYIKTYIKIHERNYVSFISITLLRCYVTKTVFS